MVIEIGPGHGILTAELAHRCRNVIAVEVDGRLCGRLRGRFGDAERVSVVHADFLRYSLPKGIPYKVVGNIPFNRTAAIVQRLAAASTPPVDIFIIVQREAAERFAGGPFASESVVSLHLKPWWQVEIVRRLRRADFEPAPRVDAALLWLARRTRPLVDASTTIPYRTFIDTSFGRTGTTIGRCLRASFTHHQIRQLSQDLRFAPGSPPSALSFDQWLGLFRFRMLQPD